MDTTLRNRQSDGKTNTQNETFTLVHPDRQPQPEKLKSNWAKSHPRELTWIACQAVKLGPRKTILLRSFPFWALSIQHAIKEVTGAAIAAKEKLEFTHIHELGNLTQRAGKPTKSRANSAFHPISGAKK